MLRGSFGSYLLAGGAVGEFFPIVAIAIFLGSNGRFLGLMSLLAVAVIALVLSLIPRLGRGGRLAQILTEGQNATIVLITRLNPSVRALDTSWVSATRITGRQVWMFGPMFSSLGISPVHQKPRRLALDKLVDSQRSR
jgi:hypothetical protein